MQTNEMLETLRRVATAENPPLDTEHLFELMRQSRREVIQMHPELEDALPQPPVVSSRQKEDGSIEWAM